MNIEDCKKIDRCPLCNYKLNINTEILPKYLLYNIKLEGDNYNKICTHCNNFYFAVESGNIILLKFKIDDVLYFMDDDKYENEIYTFIDNDDDIFINVDFKMLPKSFDIEEFRVIIKRLLDLSIYS